MDGGRWIHPRSGGTEGDRGAAAARPRDRRSTAGSPSRDGPRSRRRRAQPKTAGSSPCPSAPRPAPGTARRGRRPRTGPAPRTAGHLQPHAVGEQPGPLRRPRPSAGTRRRRPRAIGMHGQLLLELRPACARRVQPVRADAGAAQRGQVAADAEPGAQVAGEGPDVRAGGADDRDDQVEHRRAVLGDRRRGRRARAKDETVTGRAGISNSSPSRTRVYERTPSILMALTLDGTCMMSPVSAAIPASMASRVTPAASARRR